MATYHEKVVELCAAEAAILQALMRFPDGVLTADELERACASLEGRNDSRSLDEHIESFCTKFCQRIVRRVRGVGYRLTLGGACRT